VDPIAGLDDVENQDPSNIFIILPHDDRTARFQNFIYVTNNEMTESGQLECQFTYRRFLLNGGANVAPYNPLLSDDSVTSYSLWETVM
jgi:hypothetical protein